MSRKFENRFQGEGTLNMQHAQPGPSMMPAHMGAQMPAQGMVYPKQNQLQVGAPALSSRAVAQVC